MKDGGVDGRWRRMRNDLEEVFSAKQHSLFGRVVGKGAGGTGAVVGVGC